jgi:hypothetical protein
MGQLGTRPTCSAQPVRSKNMLKYIERELRESGKEGPAQIVKGLRDTLGKDIPFPIAELSLKQVAREYGSKPTNLELLTQFMSVFWHESGQRIGKNIVVDKFPSTAKEIKEQYKKGYMAIYLPHDVNREDLRRMFPIMERWALPERHYAADLVNNAGWLWIEYSVDAPNRNTTQALLEEKFKKDGKQGQSLRSYIVGSQISKLLDNKYFDQRGTYSRLLGSCRGDMVLDAYFGSRGDLHMDPYWIPSDHSHRIGGRSEEVIKP